MEAVTVHSALGMFLYMYVLKENVKTHTFYETSKHFLLEDNNDQTEHSTI